MKRIIPLLLLLVGFAAPIKADLPTIKEYTLYGGSNLDTLEKASPWIPVRGARRVIIRLWSAKAAFHASTDADSIYSDSIAIFRVAFTDSVASVNPIIAGDSVIVTSTVQANADTTVKGVVVLFPPLHESLRGPDNGSGIYTFVLPAAMVTAASQQFSDNNGFIGPQYMRIYITARRRMTVTGGQMTEGKRTVGLKGLRGRALVVYSQ